MAEHESQQDLETLKEDVSKLRSDLAELAKKFIDIGKSETKAATDKLLKDLNQQLDGAREHGRKTVETMEQKIQEKPFISLFLAFILGLLLGKLLDRK